MIHMLDIGIGIDGGIGLYCRKQHLDRFVIVDSIVQMFFFGCTIVTMIYHIDYQSMDWCHFGTLGSSVRLLLPLTRREVEKFDGAVRNYSGYVSFDVWMINTSQRFKANHVNYA